MKRGKLYKLNKWNRPAFLASYQEVPNIFDGGGPLNPFPSQMQITSTPVSPFGKINPLEIDTTQGNLGSGIQKTFFGNIKHGISNAFGGEEGKNLATGALSAAGNLVGRVGGELIANGYEDKTTDTVTGIGHSAADIVGMINPIAGAVGHAAVGVLGGLGKRAFGMKTNKELLGQVNAGIDKNRNFVSNAQEMDELKGLESTVTNFNVHKNGWFNTKGTRRNKALARNAIDAKGWAERSQDNNVNNILTEDMNDYLANYTAYGGPLDMGPVSGAIDYGFMSDYLLNKKKQADSRGGNNLLAPSTNLFEDGGGIDIKHPGRLTELKKRTGKTEAELWSEGNPDVRKMITFARSARKWNHHGYGGYLEGRVYDIPKEEVQRLINSGYEIEYV